MVNGILDNILENRAPLTELMPLVLNPEFFRLLEKYAIED